MDQVIENEGPEYGHLRHREDLDVAVLERPGREHLRIGHRDELCAGRADLPVELLEEGRTRDRGPRPRVFAGGSNVELRLIEDGVAPVRDVGEMPGELAERHRLLVRLPAELRLRRPLE